ncbi:MAG: hypothetical protein WD359_07915 [Dehalococcoidia bacterium]
MVGADDDQHRRRERIVRSLNAPCRAAERRRLLAEARGVARESIHDHFAVQFHDGCPEVVDQEQDREVSIDLRCVDFDTRRRCRQPAERALEAEAPHARRHRYVSAVARGIERQRVAAAADDVDAADANFVYLRQAIAIRIVDDAQANFPLRDRDHRRQRRRRLFAGVRRGHRQQQQRRAPECNE